MKMEIGQVKAELLELLAVLSNTFNEDQTMKNELLEILKFNTGDEETDKYYNDKFKMWFDLIEENVIYDNDGGFYCFTDDILE